MIAFTNDTNIFNFVPSEVTQWKIAPFLEPIDRANLNAVLEPTERVYKRLPADFAKKHALRAAYVNQRRHANLINLLTDYADTAAYAVQGVTAIGRYAEFFLKPVAFPLFESNTEKIIDELNNFISEDSVFAPYMTADVREKIIRVIEVVN